MAKPVADFVRFKTALVAAFVIIALRAKLAADDLPAADSLETVPRIEFQLDAAAGNDVRLSAVEAKLQDSLSTPGHQDDANAPTIRIGGLVQVDYLWIGQSAANEASVGSAQDVFNLRRARLTARGEAYEVVEYAVGFDFALEGRPSFLDNYIAVHELPVLGSVLVGHFFEPFSLERYTLVRFTTFSERSLLDALAPARNLGIMARDSVGEQQRSTWALGWFRSNSDVYGDDFTDIGGNAVTGRMTWLPYYDESEARYFLHLGTAYTYRSEANHVLHFQQFPEARAGTPGPLGIPPFVDTGILAARSDQRFGTELAVVYGPMHIQGEYVVVSVDQSRGRPLHFQAAYGFISYFLTGESRTYNKSLGTMDRVYPFENFFRVRSDRGIENGRGAWEISARWSFIDLDSRNVRGGTLNDGTLSLTWHLNPYTRIRWEYIYAQLNRAPVGSSSAEIGGIRFDVDF